MAGGPSPAMLAELGSRPGRDTLLSSLLRWALIGVSLLFLAALLIAPLITVFATALSKGVAAYLAAFGDPAHADHRGRRGPREHAVRTGSLLVHRQVRI